VAERTAELTAANEMLTAQIARRERAEEDRRELLRRLATAQEDERRRVAVELHDQMGQLLVALALGLKAVELAIPDNGPAMARLLEVKHITHMIDQEVHQLAWELRPAVLDDLGLVAALTTYVEEWAARSGVAADFVSIGLETERIPLAGETALYRVVQEALTNVLRHARAKRVSVVLQRTPDGATVVVEDDGTGFDPEGPSRPGRLGLLGMQERVELVGGTLTVESVPGNGTTVIAQVPVPAAGGAQIREPED
jgi:two-component system CheB/CheR fusion protein